MIRRYQRPWHEAIHVTNGQQFQTFQCLPRRPRPVFESKNVSKTNKPKRKLDRNSSLVVKVKQPAKQIVLALPQEAYNIIIAGVQIRRIYRPRQRRVSGMRPIKDSHVYREQTRKTKQEKQAKLSANPLWLATRFVRVDMRAYKN